MFLLLIEKMADGGLAKIFSDLQLPSEVLAKFEEQKVSSPSMDQIHDGHPRLRTTPIMPITEHDQVWPVGF